MNGALATNGAEKSGEGWFQYQIKPKKEDLTLKTQTHKLLFWKNNKHTPLV
jgi:hypothetical protein